MLAEISIDDYDSAIATIMCKQCLSTIVTPYFLDTHGPIPTDYPHKHCWNCGIKFNWCEIEFGDEVIPPAV